MVTTLKDIKTTDFHVIPARATILEASKTMANLDVGLLPVTEDGQIVGTITDRDIVVRSVAEGHNPAETPISMAMTPKVIRLSEDEDFNAAARVMEENQIRRLIVTDKENRPAGIVSLGDIAVKLNNTGLAGEVLKTVSKSVNEGEVTREKRKVT